MQRTIATLALMLLPSLAGADVPLLPEEHFPQLGSLMESVETSSPAIMIETRAGEAAQAALKQAESARAPHLYSYYRLQGMHETRIDSDYETNDTTFGPYASLNATFPLYHWDEFDARTGAAKESIRATEAWKRARVMQVRQELRRNYVEYQLALQAAAIAREGVEYGRRNEDGLRALLEKGQAARQSLVEAELFTHERMEELLDAENRAGNHLDLIRESLGQPDLQIEPAEFPEAVFLDDAMLAALGYSAATARLPAIEAIEAEIGVEKNYSREARSRNRPKLDLVASGALDYIDEYRSGGDYENVPRLIGWMGLQVSWTLLDGGSADADRMVNLARSRRHEARLDELMLRQAREASGIEREARLCERRHATRAGRLELLEESVRMMEAQLAGNLVSANDLFRLKLDLERTRLELVRSDAYYLLALAQLTDMATYEEER